MPHSWRYERFSHKACFASLKNDDMLHFAYDWTALLCWRFAWNARANDACNGFFMMLAIFMDGVVKPMLAIRYSW